MRWADGFIAVDWGTTNRRAYRIDSSGKQTDEFEDGKGVLSVPDGGFPAAVAEIRERLGDKPLLLAGMVGSNRGWNEAPYVPCPAGIDDLAAKLVWASEREAIVPGVSYIGDGRADVMRGEEVQLLGAVAAGLVDPDALVCHPGTHNKWALLRRGNIHDFRTVMTGELFSLLKEHSILADLLQGEVAVNDAFREAARRAHLQRGSSRRPVRRPRRCAARPGEEGGRGLLDERAADRHRTCGSAFRRPTVRRFTSSDGRS